MHGEVRGPQQVPTHVMSGTPRSIPATVMGPGGQATDNLGALSLGSMMDPPRFISNQTEKVQYRETLRMWIKMMNQFAIVDTRARAIVQGGGYVIYRYCDRTAQELITKAITTGSVKLEGENTDPEREQLVEHIISTIAKDSPTERVRREVDMLTDIQNCQRTSTEQTLTFATRFNSVVAQYINQTTGLTDVTNR